MLLKNPLPEVRLPQEDLLQTILIHYGREWLNKMVSDKLTLLSDLYFVRHLFFAVLAVFSAARYHSDGHILLAQAYLLAWHIRHLPFFEQRL